MVKFLIFVFLLCFALFGLVRCFVCNIHNVAFYSVWDIIDYIKNKKWKLFNLYGIDMFIGMFGHGKTLSMTHKARMIYNKYGDSVRFISNYKLIGIPYIPLINFAQLVDLGEEDDNKYIGTVVLIDEIENVLSHRNFANFPLALLHTLTQQRKKHIYIMCSAQRFFMVDKLFRSITTNVIDCKKYWRFQHVVYYDAWDYENGMNPQLIKPLASRWWFVKNGDFNCYDTEQMVSKDSAEMFISNDESLQRKGLDSVVNDNAVIHSSKRAQKQRKKR